MVLSSTRGNKLGDRVLLQFLGGSAGEAVAVSPEALQTAKRYVAGDTVVACPDASTSEVLIPRHITGALVDHVGLSLGSLGKAFIEPPADLAYVETVGQWWDGLSAEQRIPRGILAVLAAPALAVEIRTQDRQRRENRNWTMTGGLRPDAAWMFISTAFDDLSYRVQPVRSRAAVIQTLSAQWQSGLPVLPCPMVFHCTTSEFGLLLSLADGYCRAQYASLLLHETPSRLLTLERISKEYRDSLKYPDSRFLFSFAAHLLPNAVRAFTDSQIGVLADQLVRRGLLQKQANDYAWTDAGRFLADSLHRRVFATALDVAGANRQCELGCQGSLFIRSDGPLWYFDIQPAPDGAVTGVSVSLESAGKLLDEILTPLALPPLQSELNGRKVAEGLANAVAVRTSPSDRFCQTCGAALAGGVRFCVTCGAKVA